MYLFRSGMKDIMPETCTDALSMWDANISFTSLQLGGVGPGYEMAIQGLAFEMMREYVKVNKHVWDDELVSRLKQVVKDCDKLPWGGFSGEQVSVARSFSCSVWKDGYQKTLLHPSRKHRLIQVCKLDLRK